MTNKNIFEYFRYKNYLSDRLGGTKARNGLRKKAADFIQCHTAYLSAVLNSNAQLSVEQAFRFNEFLGHDEDEKDFFLLLVQQEKAGTKELQKYFQTQMDKIHQKRNSLRGRLQSQDSISSEDKAIYYSKWYYSCLHVMISIPELQTREALSQYLKIPPSVISEALDFLETRGLAIVKNGRYEIGPRHLHLPHDSPLIGKHHTNWRNRAINALDIQGANDLHYSVVATLSAEDAVLLRKHMMDMIQNNMKIIRDSKEEQTFAFTLDFFKI
jgi:uncharacterized protein (TIGR02147 family)